MITGGERIALVTDSTSGLDSGHLHGIDVEVVPLHVLIDGDDLREGVDVTAFEVAGRLSKAKRVSTSRPSPREFLTVYERLAGAGVTRIVSIHLSGQLSGTWEAAVLAARDAPVPVTVIDSSLAAGALAQAVDAAARACATAVGDFGAVASQAVADVRATSSVLFYVHTLEYLRRGGRIGAAAAYLGGALAVKPLLAIEDGHVQPLEKLRTQNRALTRLCDLVLERARKVEGPYELVVHHVDAEQKAAKVAERLSSGPGEDAQAAREVAISPLPAVLAAHVGPGAIGVVLGYARAEGTSPH